MIKLVCNTNLIKFVLQTKYYRKFFMNIFCCRVEYMVTVNKFCSANHFRVKYQVFILFMVLCIYFLSIIIICEAFK